MYTELPKITPFSFIENTAGKMVKVTCFSTEKSVLSWEKDGTVLYNGQQNISIKEFDEMLILSISSLRPEHSGNYTCSARNRYGSSHFSAFLAVTAPPHWKTTPQSEVTLIMGSSQKLVCDVEGYPDPNVTWTLFGGMLLHLVMLPIQRLQATQQSIVLPIQVLHKIT